jgi:hypothetical protein
MFYDIYVVFLSLLLSLNNYQLELSDKGIELWVLLNLVTFDISLDLITVGCETVSGYGFSLVLYFPRFEESEAT